MARQLPNSKINPSAETSEDSQGAAAARRRSVLKGVEEASATSGYTLAERDAAKRLITEFAASPDRSSDHGRLDELTDHELEVLKLVARGMTNKEVAEELYVSETTVKTHVSHVLTKLGIRDRVQVVVVAYESGLVQPGDASI
jgi:DNA-binding NarL/FixJ family response regulator